ncbi:hypothetical protein BHAOGJBA_1356 [Methylobacterium hispanicum]|uniref:AbiEi antitoxin C-terminal domain-containing protein n=1 Tax=Methylobacterium hispanicum TaxID=270350 RepID=A0AAV4ZJ43_9HYPH|nr:DUF6088 family protein [Methylobacterium hispanicum]GJD87851.1 hypothetical protein BHAOGJBA_1356 [Methylobacterium hispanicum]
MAPPLSPLRLELMRRMQAGAAAGQVFTWSDFADLGPHEIVERHLLRLAASSEGVYVTSRASGDWDAFFAEFRVLRVARGVYYSPSRNRMTKRPTVPMAEHVVAAVVSRLGGRWLVPPEAAAHELGITNLVPARLVVETDLRLQPISLGNRTIEFQTRSARRLHWAGRAGGVVVQALAWAKDLLTMSGDEQERARIRRCVSRHLASEKGPEARIELQACVALVEDWMRGQIDLAMEEAGLDPVFAPSWHSGPAGDGEGPDPDEPQSGMRP